MKILVVAPPGVTDQLFDLVRNLGCEPSLVTCDVHEASRFLDVNLDTDFVIADQAVHGFNYLQLKLAFVESRRARQTRVFAIGDNYRNVLDAAVVAAKRHGRMWERGPQFETPLDAMRKVFEEVLAASRVKPKTRRELFSIALSRQ